MNPYPSLSCLCMLSLPPSMYSLKSSTKLLISNVIVLSMTNQLEDAPTKTEQEEAPNQDMNFNNPSDYGCQILLEKTTLDAANDKTFPNDARLVWYIVDGTEYIDLTRCGKVVKMFDMYYDRYGPGSVQKIDFGFGTVNPKLWGLKKKESKKK